MKINFDPIGTLHTPFDQVADMPIQPFSKKSSDGYAEIKTRYSAGLKSLEKFSHVILIYYFHQQTKTDLQVMPFLDKEKYGVFATRAPSRPNHIGISIVPLVKIENEKIFLQNLDMLNGTPLLDIKPYVPGFDRYDHANSGWLENKLDCERASDSRFKTQ